MTRRPPPISLRIRHAEAQRQARAVLRRLDEGDQLRRRVKWQATKALISIREMRSLMSTVERASCRAEYEQTLAFLEKIKRGAP